MSEESKRSWLTRRAEEALKRGFTRAYDTVKVDPAKYLLQLQAAHGLPISSFNGVFSVEVGALDNVAGDIVRGAMKVAAVEGAGLGVAGRSEERRVGKEWRTRWGRCRGKKSE